jgi:Xaa-Pro aminopeptidase
MTKDDWEIEQMRAAVAATHVGFEAVIADLRGGSRARPRRALGRGHLRAARPPPGNGVGYDSICAAGDHANTLHWIKNTGEVREGDLVLLDAGVEVDSLYTADITRTLPVDGTFTDAQREIYDAVYAAQQAGIAAVRPARSSPTSTRRRSGSSPSTCTPGGCSPTGRRRGHPRHRAGQYHRRWMVHGTSHHLGLDVHDCALATREEYMDAELAPRHGPHRRAGALLQGRRPARPERFRGIGVRIEDDVLVTDTGHEPRERPGYPQLARPQRRGRRAHRPRPRLGLGRRPAAVRPLRPRRRLRRDEPQLRQLDAQRRGHACRAHLHGLQHAGARPALRRVGPPQRRVTRG